MTLATLLFTVAVSAQGPAPADVPDHDVPILYLVAIGSPDDHVASLAQYYRDALQLRVEVLPAFTPPLDIWNAQQMTWRAEDLTAALTEHEESRLHSRNAALIGIVADNLQSKQDPWLFGWRTGARVGVVSYAHMAATPGPDAGHILETRLRRMVTRYVGLLALDLQASPDRQSPLYDSIRSTADLDAIGDDLLAAGFVLRRPLTDYSRPVDLATGLYGRRETDARLDDAPSIVFDRTYNSADVRNWGQPFGIGANHSYGSFLVGDAEKFRYLELVLESGTRIRYRRTSPGTGWANGIFVHDASSSEYLHSQISWHDGGWLLELADGRSYRHPDCSAHPALPCTVSGVRDRQGRELQMRFDDVHRLARIETPNHKVLELTYDAANRIIGLKDQSGRTRTYEYDGRGRLIDTRSPGAGTTSYAYDEHNRMTSARAPGLLETMAYDAAGRCTRYEWKRQAYVDPSGHVFERTGAIDYAYELASPTDKYARTVTMSDGRSSRRLTFNADGYVVRDAFGVGTPLEQITSYERDPRSKQARRLTVACGGSERGGLVEESLTTGQDVSTVVGRARTLCDSRLIAASR